MWLLLVSLAHAGGDENEPLYLYMPAQNGLRNWLSDSWGTLEIAVANRGSEDRSARLIVFYSGQPDVQYARDLWVPGNSTHTSWMLLGPPPPEQERFKETRDVQMLLYDRTGGQNRLVLPPGDERVRFRGFLYKPRYPVTTVLLDQTEHTLTSGIHWSWAADQALRLVYAFRQQAKQLPLHLEIIRDRFLPPLVEGFDGIDWFVLAGRRLAKDPPGELALRKWIEQGGNLWVMLDLTDPDVVARLLGDNLPIQIVDRTSLVRMQILSPEIAASEQSPPLELEQPVDFVRVLLTPEDTLLHTINGWPASFTRSYGRGRVLFTTVGAQAWFRERTSADRKSPSDSFPDLPVPLEPLDELAQKFGMARPAKVPYAEILEPLVASEVGYAVPGPRMAAMLFGAFIFLALALGLVLHRATHRLEIPALIAPALALITSLVFFVIGRETRNAVPPVVSAADIIHVAPATAEQLAQGLIAQYGPDPGDLPLASTRGGILELDEAGLEGKARRRVMTDTRAWHWEDLAFPAGLRLGRYERSVATAEPLSAIAQFGPDGLAGRIAAGPFSELADALLSTSAGCQVSVHLKDGGAFSIGNDDVLPPGQYLADVVLNDQQQRRAEVFRRLLSEGDSSERDGRTILYVWSKPPAIPFTFDPRARTVASSLLAIPVEFVNPAADTHVSVPRAFLPCRRIVDGRPAAPTLESSAAVDMQLRFQIPTSLLPLKPERARFFAKVRAPQRRFTVAGFKTGKRVELFDRQSVIAPLTVDITDEALLKLDDQGGLHVNVAVGELPVRADRDSAGADLRWSIESIQIEVTGRTLRVN